MAVAAQRSGGAAVAAERVGLAVTGLEAQRTLESPDDARFDLVVLRHAWASPTDFHHAVATWKGRLETGGALVAAEPALEPLLVGSAVRYPAGLWLRHLPEIADRLADTLVGETRLGPGLVSAGLRDVEIHRVDEEGPVYDGPKEFWKATRPGLPDDVIAAAADDFATLTGPLEDRRPWNVAVGFAR